MTEDNSPENLRKFLKSDDPAMVRMGISMAKGTESPEDYHQTLLQTLQRLLESHEPEMRRMGLSLEASDIPEEFYKNVFGLSLWDPEEENREAAGKLVEEIGMKNITEFPGWLEPFEKGDVDEEVRYYAACALGEIGDKRAVEPLIEMLSYEDGAENVPWDVVKALGEIGDKRAGEPLIEMLFYNPSIVYVPKALDKIGWVPETDRQRAAYSIAAEDWKSVVECGESAVEALIKLLTPRVDWWMTKPAVEALGEIGSARAVEPLIEMLSVEGDNIKDDKNYDEDADFVWDEELRDAAMEALGKIGDARAVEPLFWALEDNIEAAAKALGKIGGIRAVELLIEELKGGASYMTKPAIEALGEIGDTRAVKPLIELLEDMRGYDSMTVAQLKKVLKDRYQRRFPYRAGLTSKQLSGKKADLIARLDDKDVREAAKEALKKLGHEVE